MTELRDLYQEVILDHNKAPRNFRELDGADRRADGDNPLCGDRLTVFVKLDGNTITEASFVGSGCAISKASASLMTDAVKGKSVPAARRLFEQFHEMVTDRSVPADSETLGKLVVFEGVRDYPARVKCASLAWHTLHAAIDNSHEIATTE